METTTKVKTNDLRHTITTKDSEGNDLVIEIRLNDECKNGHQDFSITGSGFTKGKPHTDRNCIYGGCCHEKIEKARPSLKMFINLHLCDWEGIPMYAVENGFYHLRSGFNNTKPNETAFKAEFCEYYRITPQQFDTLNKCHNKTQYAVCLKDLGILKQWKAEAEAAIKALEELTGQEFLSDSVKSQYNAPTLAEITEDMKRVNSGYYTPEAIKEREEAAKSQKVAEIRDEARRKADAELAEAELKVQLFLIGGERLMDNTIFYNHTNTIKFNWKRFGDNLTADEIEAAKSQLILPIGVKFEN